MTERNKAENKFRIHYLMRLFVFWLLIFILFRFIFLAFHFNIVINNGLSLALKSLFAGIRLDLSAITYLIIPSFLLWGIQQFIPLRILSILNSTFNIGMLFLICVLDVSTIKMYHEWKALINIGVFNYLANPGQVIAFISGLQLILLLLFIGIYFVITFWIFRKLVTGFTLSIGNYLQKAASILLLTLILPVLARGGLQLAPINESAAYFSNIPFYNHVATNPIWYFIHSYLDANPEKNPFIFMDASSAEKRNNTLFLKTNIPDENILNLARPNIVIFILESWTADIIQSLGGEEGITPNFDSLRKEGLLFTQVYAAGSRTEHGLISVLSGFPPPPHVSIITIPYKVQKLHNINEVFANEGYGSSFYYGGEIGFVNMKSYLITSRFNKIIDKNNFEKNKLNSKWGAHDQFVMDRQLKDMGTTPEPFFSVILTLSSHEPFEVPMDVPFKDNSESGKFRKAIYYSDYCLGEYFREAKKEPWFDHTLFILVADHGHRLPKNTDLNRPESKRIPLLFFGGALKEEFRDKTINKICNQNDLAATLLNQLGQSYADFPRSKDILNSGSTEFAYYANDDVLGWITTAGSIAYFYTNQEVLNYGNVPVQVKDSLLLDAKAYVQTHYQQYLNY